MTGAERGFLLLTSRLGDVERKILTAPQCRMLAQRVSILGVPGEDRELTAGDLVKLGYHRDMAERILGLLSQEDVLDHYLARGREAGCVPIARPSGYYPETLKNRLGWECPGSLWAKGDLSLLKEPAIALVGSRELRQENRLFARAVGAYAAEKGLVLISGNARGADREAQEACLAAGGRVISIVAGGLWDRAARCNMLYLSEDGFDCDFSAQRALSRNRCIHALGQLVFVAQAELEKGGSWGGTVRNLHNGWTPVLCFRDGSVASLALEDRGAYLITREELADFSLPGENQMTMF